MDVKLFGLRKGIRSMIYDYIDFRDFNSVKSLNNEELFRVNVRKLKMSEFKFSSAPLALENLNNYDSFHCCISLEPQMKDCIAFTSRNSISIFNTVTNTNSRYTISDDDSVLYRICLVKNSNSAENTKYSLFSISSNNSNFKIWAFNDDITNDDNVTNQELIKCVGTKSLNSRNYWAMKVIEKGENLDIVISGYSGISLFRGNRVKLVNGDLSEGLSEPYHNHINTHKISNFEVIGDLIFCGDDDRRVQILDYDTFQVLKSVKEHQYFGFYIRCLTDITAYKRNHVAIATETNKNGLTLWNYLRTKEEVKFNFVEGYDFNDVLITIFYMKLNYRNFIIAGSGQANSEVYVINLDKKEKVFRASLNSLWISYIASHQEKQIMVVGNSRITLLDLW